MSDDPRAKEAQDVVQYLRAFADMYGNGHNGDSPHGIYASGIDECCLYIEKWFK